MKSISNIKIENFVVQVVKIQNLIDFFKKSLAHEFDSSSYLTVVDDVYDDDNAIIFKAYQDHL